jgi:hypothetical protein
METPPVRCYKFNFLKDRFWIWAMVLPFGLICWAIPFAVFFGLLIIRNSPNWFPMFGFIFLGIPAYLVGWIFVYSFMEGIYTKVTITENWISIRLPWLIFPVLPITKKVDIDEINRMNLFAPYGSRTAVFLYFYDRSKERHFYLPRFKHNQNYINDILTIQKKVEANHAPTNLE